MNKDESYYDKNSCRERKCTDYKNQVCTDSITYRIDGVGVVCCRYHKRAVKVD